MFNDVALCGAIYYSISKSQTLSCLSRLALQLLVMS